MPLTVLKFILLHILIVLSICFKLLNTHTTLTYINCLNKSPHNYNYWHNPWYTEVYSSSKDRVNSSLYIFSFEIEIMKCISL